MPKDELILLLWHYTIISYQYVIYTGQNVQVVHAIQCNVCLFEILYHIRGVPYRPLYAQGKIVGEAPKYLFLDILKSENSFLKINMFPIPK